jgi:hypothetical protein
MSRIDLKNVPYRLKGHALRAKQSNYTGVGNLKTDFFGCLNDKIRGFRTLSLDGFLPALLWNSNCKQVDLGQLYCIVVVMTVFKARRLIVACKAKVAVTPRLPAKCVVARYSLKIQKKLQTDID